VCACVYSVRVRRVYYVCMCMCACVYACVYACMRDFSTFSPHIIFSPTTVCLSFLKCSTVEGEETFFSSRPCNLYFHHP
jgi:hypothetical protein